MAVKRFQTRISLKTDNLANWQANQDIVLLKGEFAWADITRPDGSQIRDFKIGDGTSTWKTLPFILPVGDGSTIISGTATSEHAHVLSVGLIGSDKVNALTSYSSSGVSYTALSASDSLNTALAKLEAGIASAQTAGVTDINDVSGSISLGNGLQISSSTLSVKPTGYITTSSNGVGIDSTKIDSTYVTVNGETVTVNTSTNLATVATVTAALGTLDVSSFTIAKLGNSSDHGSTAQGGSNHLAIYSVSESDGKIAVGSSNHYVYIDIDDKNPYKPGDLDQSGHYQQGTPLATVATVINAVNEALDSEVTFQGVASSLPANPANGDMYKVTADVSIPQASAGQGAAVTAHSGDTIIYKGGTGAGVGWYVIPSGDDSFTSTGITLVNGDPGYQNNTSTVSDALQSLATIISSSSAGTLDTTTATTGTLSGTSESLHGTVQLHKVSKTGNIADLGQATASTSSGLTNTPDMIILECGSATVNTLS